MSHISVLLHETVDALLANRDTGIYIDGTFGRGGHTRLLLSKLGSDAQVYGFDKDPQALAVAHQLEQEDLRFKIIHASFADIQTELEQRGITQVEGVMADLGSLLRSWIRQSVVLVLCKMVHSICVWIIHREKLPQNGY